MDARMRYTVFLVRERYDALTKKWRDEREKTRAEGAHL